MTATVNPTGEADHKMPLPVAPPYTSQAQNSAGAVVGGLHWGSLLGAALALLWLL